MSLNADFIYNNDWHDVSNRVVFNYFSALHPDREDECSIECQVTLEQLLELHKMLCGILYKEQMDLDMLVPTVYEETISSVRNAIKAMKSNLEVWYDGSY